MCIRDSFSGKLPLISNESYAKNSCNPLLHAPFKHKLWHTFPLVGKWRRRLLTSSVWLLQDREDIRSFSFYSPFPRKSQSWWCSNERWHLLFKHCSQGQLNPSISKFRIGYQGFHHTCEKKHLQCLGLVLIFPLIPKCSGLNFHWCQLSSMRWRGKHLWQIIPYWSKSTGGTRHWLHRGTEWWLGAGEDVLLIKCRKRTEKIFS